MSKFGIVGRRSRRNHVCKIWRLSVQELLFSDGVNFLFPIDLRYRGPCDPCQIHITVVLYIELKLSLLNNSLKDYIYLMTYVSDGKGDNLPLIIGVAVGATVVVLIIIAIIIIAVLLLKKKRFDLFVNCTLLCVSVNWTFTFVLIVLIVCFISPIKFGLRVYKIHNP